MGIILGVVFTLLAFGAGILIAAVITGGAIIRTHDAKSRLAYIETCVFTLSAIVLASYIFAPAFLYHAITAVSFATLFGINRMDPEELLDIKLSDIV